MTEATVALTRCDDYSKANVAQAVERQFELLGGLERFVKRDDSVLIKPNLIAPRSHRCATQTDPAVILETARILKDFGAKPFVGDSPAWGNVFTCIKALKLQEPLKELGVAVRQLNKPKKFEVGKHNARVGISTVALDADVIINLPKFKSHQQLVATFAVKNMFGCVSGKQKAYWHFAQGETTEQFCEFLIEIYRFLQPALTIIDGVIAMDGPGPIRGRARSLGWMIGGTDPIACERICCRLVGIDPGDVPIIQTAEKMDFGCSGADKIKIVGDNFSENTYTDFEIPKLIPVRFSLVYVCRSILKQIVLLTRLAIKKFTPDRN